MSVSTRESTPMVPVMAIEDECCKMGFGEGPIISADEAEAYAVSLRALADPTRLRILNLLTRREDAVCVCEFVDWLPLGQSTISHHLKILRDAHLVFAERRGTFMYYQANPASAQTLALAIQQILSTHTTQTT